MSSLLNLLNRILRNRVQILDEVVCVRTDALDKDTNLCHSQLRIKHENSLKEGRLESYRGSC